MSRPVLLVLALLMVPVSSAHAMLLCAKKDKVSGQVKENATIKFRSSCKSSEIALPLSLENGGQTVRITARIFRSSTGPVRRNRPTDGQFDRRLQRSRRRRSLGSHGFAQRHRRHVPHLQQLRRRRGRRLQCRNSAVWGCHWAHQCRVGNASRRPGRLVQPSHRRGCRGARGSFNGASGSAAVLVGGQDNDATGTSAVLYRWKNQYRRRLL